MNMSETNTISKFPHQDGDVKSEDLKKHVEENPHLYPGVLGEAVRRAVEGEDTLGPKQAQDMIESDRLKSDEITDSIGWRRLVAETPVEGIKVVFKGRFDIPQIEELERDGVVVSLRPLYHDERRGISGGVISEQQIAYSGARGSDPRLIMNSEGLMVVLDRALSASNGKDIILVCDETPQGFRALFQAIKSHGGEQVLSDLAKRMCATEYNGLEEMSEETREVFSEFAVELAALLSEEDMTPHQALELIYYAHVGDAASRNESSL